MERDVTPLYVAVTSAISTHTLTWSVTNQVKDDFLKFFTISTHTLTWSVTQRIQLFHMLSVISTHTLTWSVTIISILAVLVASISTHTLTWSVTVSGHIRYTERLYFNSHAHVERDPSEEEYIVKLSDFNSHAHVERDGGEERCR